MNKLLGKKINLLLHIANVDGKYDESEKRVLQELLTESGLAADYLDRSARSPVDLNDIQEQPKQEELLFWIMTMIKADGYLHQDEIAFAKAIAIKLGFTPSAVDFFAKENIVDRNHFVSKLKSFRAR